MFLGPWLQDLSEITGLNRLAVFDNLAYVQTYRLGVIFGVAQMVVLLVLVLISIFKPELEPCSPAARQLERRLAVLLRPVVAPFMGLQGQICNLLRLERD